MLAVIRGGQKFTVISFGIKDGDSHRIKGINKIAAHYNPSPKENFFVFKMDSTYSVSNMQIPTSTKTIIFENVGNPSDVLKIKSQPLPECGPDEIMVKMILCAVNPSDINFIEGRYGIKPSLPAVAGLDGVGVILVTGAKVNTLHPGQLVRLHPGHGSWRQYVVLKPTLVEAYPDGLTLEQASIFSVNPITAWCLLSLFKTIGPGQWLIQNAATSAVGKYVIQLARQRRLRTVNLVRDPKAIAPLQALGGDVVLEDKEGVEDQITALTGKAEIKLGLNAVGGESALRMMSAMGQASAMVTYGALSKQALKVPNSFLIFKNIELRGFWLTQWKKQTARGQQLVVERELTELFKSGHLDTFIQKIYPLEDFAEALTQAQASGRSGKILIEFNEDTATDS